LGIIEPIKIKPTAKIEKTKLIHPPPFIQSLSNIGQMSCQEKSSKAFTGKAPSKIPPRLFESFVGLDETFLKGYQVCKKPHCFSGISEISLDKSDRIWSMNKRGRESLRGERADGSQGLLWLIKGGQPQRRSDYDPIESRMSELRRDS
jgi:hypothetical protein